MARSIVEMAAEIGEVSATKLPALILLLLDIEKACPSVPRTAAREVVHRAGIPEHMCEFIEHLHGNCSYRVKTSEGLSRAFSLDKGFREGDPSSPVCFNIYHSAVMTDLRQRLITELDTKIGAEIGWQPCRPLGCRQKDDPKSAEFFVGRLIDLLCR